jgi:hypothetical protein
MSRLLRRCQTEFPEGNGVALAAVARLSGSTFVAFLRDREQRVINALAISIFIVILLIRVVFSTAKPGFPRGSELASLTADLGIAYLAAWFFYYLVSWRPAYKTRQRLALMVSRQAFGAMAHASQLSLMLRGSSGSPETGPMSRQELASICDELHLLSDSTDVSIADPTVHASVLRSICRHFELVCIDVHPIVQAGGLFDADVVADATAL